jgi:hypothetical protein
MSESGQSEKSGRSTPGSPYDGSWVGSRLRLGAMTAVSRAFSPAIPFVARANSPRGLPLIVIVVARSILIEINTLRVRILDALRSIDLCWLQSSDLPTVGLPVLPVLL